MCKFCFFCLFAGLGGWVSLEEGDDGVWFGVDYFRGLLRETRLDFRRHFFGRRLNEDYLWIHSSICHLLSLVRFGCDKYVPPNFTKEMWDDKIRSTHLVYSFVQMGIFARRIDELFFVFQVRDWQFKTMAAKFMLLSYTHSFTCDNLLFHLTQQTTQL